MRKIISSLFFFLYLQNTLPVEITGKVKNVYDGDTLTIETNDNQTKRIRLLAIDTPEIDFNGNSQGNDALIARDYLSSLLPTGTEITVDVADYSIHHKRLLGTIYHNGTNINLFMIMAGMAAPYIISPFDINLTKEYLLAAKIAFESQEGILFDDIYMPYEFRMIVQERVGTNYVANLETKRLYLPDEVHKVPYFNRIFFRSIKFANKSGYFLK